MEVPFRHIRNDFPILQEKVYGKELIYLDNAATTQKPRVVVETIEQGYYKTNANIHRGVHYLSMRATEAHESARACVARFLNASDPAEIVFTRGTTEAINLVASSFGEAFCNEGDVILCSEMEHHSNIVPWQLLCQRKKLQLKVIPILDNGDLDRQALRTMLTSDVRLLAITHVSNVLGTINPVKEIIRLAHEHNIAVLIDGAQAVPHVKVDVLDLDADFYAFSGHKMYGPAGIGVLYGKRKWLDQMPPYQGGGEMIAQVHFSGSTWNELPYKFEAGTPDFIGSTALAKAIEYVEHLDMDAIARYETDLMHYATDALLQLGDVRIFGTSVHKSAVISFQLGNIHPFDVGTLLDRMGLALRTGHHCAQPLMDRFGIEGTIRASFAVYNVPEEVDALITALKRIRTMF